MPSLEERRKVAARLRVLASHVPADAEMVLDALDLYEGEYIEGFDPRTVQRLADLIEPQQTHICLGCIKWTAIEGNPVKGVCAEFSDPEDGIERATPYYGYCHEWEDA